MRVLQEAYQSFHWPVFVRIVKLQVDKIDSFMIVRLYVVFELLQLLGIYIAFVNKNESLLIWTQNTIQQNQGTFVLAKPLV